MLRRTSLHLLLALWLLLCQQFAAAHAVSHPDAALAPDHACELCLASAHLAGALPSAAPALQPEVQPIERTAVRRSAHCPQPRLAFRSRAPPAPL